MGKKVLQAVEQGPVWRKEEMKYEWWDQLIQDYSFNADFSAREAICKAEEYPAVTQVANRIYVLSKNLIQELLMLAFHRSLTFKSGPCFKLHAFNFPSLLETPHKPAKSWKTQPSGENLWFSSELQPYTSLSTAKQK